MLESETRTRMTFHNKEDILCVLFSIRPRRGTAPAGAWWSCNTQLGQRGLVKVSGEGHTRLAKCLVGGQSGQ